MNTTPSRLRLSQDLVLVGGGHTHALILRKWGMDPLLGARLTLISPEPTAPYTGMLPGHVAGHYPRTALDIDLVQLCRHAGARLILSRAVDINRTKRHVVIEDGPPVAYDVLSLDVGIHGAVPSVSGLAEHGVPAKPLGSFADHWEAFVKNGGGPIAIIGGGVAGVELALAAAWRLRNKQPEITLIDHSSDVLTSIGSQGTLTLKQALTRAGVETITGTDVAAVEPAQVRLSDGRSVPAAFTIGAAGAVPYPWLAASGLTTPNGYVAVDRHLRSPEDPAIFAAGDCAHMIHSPRDKAGVFAVRQAPVLLHNLRSALRGRERTMRAYHPQKDYLKLVSMGRKKAVCLRSGLSVQGRGAWFLKDWIDRRFMAKLNILPGMQDDVPPNVAKEALASGTLCAGCGAKAGASALAQALASSQPQDRDDVAMGIGDDAAALKIGDRFQVLSTDTVRGFTEDPRLLARVATVHALGDIWAMGADPQSALLTVTLPRMTPSLEIRTLREAIGAVRAVLDEEGAALVGGHSGLGAELSVGLTVTGLADRLIRQGGARAGDLLILTKPIGTGVVLAGAMAGRASGADVAACWEMMARSSGAAARVLRGWATAMTDVTGFGLANHLLGILRASHLAANLNSVDIPFLSGALPLASAGVRSSLFEANFDAAGGVTPPLDDQTNALLYDPQTAGGLLATVPAERAEDVLAAVQVHDPEASLIGEIIEGPPAIRLR